MDSKIRLEIKQGLDKCSSEQVMLFKRMYSHKDLSKKIDKVVDDMNGKDLRNALFQIENSSFS